MSTKVSKNKMAKPLIIGIIVSLITTIAIIAICAIAVTNLSVSYEALLVIALISMGIGAFAGGIVSAKTYKEKGFLIGALNGIAFFLITTLISIAVNPAAITIISLIKLLIFTLSSMIGGVVGVNINHKRSF